MILLVYLASRHTIRPYVYIRPLDVLLKFPRFSYRSSQLSTPQKLKENIEGLLGLYSILNLNTEQHYQSFSVVARLPKCNWANELAHSQLQYLNELTVQKERPDQDISDSPSPPNYASGDAEEYASKLVEVVKKISIEAPTS